VVAISVVLVALGLAWSPALAAEGSSGHANDPRSFLVTIARFLKGEGDEGEVVRSQRSGVYEVKLTHAPAAPIAGQPVRLKLEILDTSQKDALLAGAVPVEDAEVTATLKGTGPDEARVKLNKKEAGVFAGQHVVHDRGTSTLALRGAVPSKATIQVSFPLEARRDPTQVRLWGGIVLSVLLAFALAVLWYLGGPVRRLARAGAATLAVLIIAVGAVVVLAGRETAEHADDHADEGHGDSKQVQIPKELRDHVLKTEPVVLGTIRDHVTVNGFVEAPADRIVNVSPRVAGRVVKINVKPGDRVEAGQVLASVDSPQLAQAQADYFQAQARVELAAQERDRRKRLAELGAFTRRPLEEARKEHAQAQSDLEVAEAELTVAQKNWDRAKTLFEGGITSQRDLEVAEATYLSAKAKGQQAKVRMEEARSFLDRERQLFAAGFRSAREVEEAEAEHRKALAQLESASQQLKLLHVSPSKSGGITEIVCPISGVVADRKINLGEVVEPTTVLCTVVDLRTVWVDGEVYEGDLARVREGMPVEVTVKAYPTQVFLGKVIFISRTLDPTRRTAKVRTEIGNPREELKPGMLAEVRLVTGERPNVVLVPESAILDDVGRKLVYVENESGFVERDVRAGVSIGGKTEIKEGLRPGEIVVTRGTWELRTQIERGSGAPAMGGHGAHGGHGEEKATKGAY
jgi:cobalt-zinc-cadmium efflux system membrane fusion protein